ncbi:MAG: tetratricopeptide repeat protein [Alsobacter sp.]
MILSLLRKAIGSSQAAAVARPAATDERPVADLMDEARALAAAGEHQAALAIWGPLAHRGEGRAANNIGACFLDGLGVERDPAMGLSWLRVAAEAGDPVGMRNLAAALFQGLGGPEDPVQAFDWYRRAAEAGDVDAMDMLSWMMLEGDAVPADHSGAREWAARAAAAGHGASMTRLGLIHHHALGVERDPSAAVDWWTRAVAAGDADGAAMLGAANHLGQGVERDPQRALVLLLLARRGGSRLVETYLPAAEAGFGAEDRRRAEDVARDIASRPPWSEVLP